jgi:hypothetical protein
MDSPPVTGVPAGEGGMGKRWGAWKRVILWRTRNNPAPVSAGPVGGVEAADSERLVKNLTNNNINVLVPDHDGEPPIELNACILITHGLFIT